MARKFLKPFHIQLLLLLFAHVVPSRGPVVKRVGAKIILHLDHSLCEFPTLLRWLFLFGLRLFDWAPVIFSSAHRPFRILPHIEQANFLQRLQSHRSTALTGRWLALLRDWLFTARGLILLCYYSQPEVMAALRYMPERWARQKIRARRRALRLVEQITSGNRRAIAHDQDDRQPQRQLQSEL